MVVAATARGGPTVVVLALRADFLGACGFDPDLSRLIESNLALMGEMRPDDLYEAIEGPARFAGLRLEPGLADLVVRDVAHEPGGLPLLSHAMLETWVRRRRRTLTVDGYRASGGVRGAIAGTAESIYASLDPGEQEITRNIFLRLTDVGEGTEETRRRATWLELTTGAEPEAAGAVLRRLADARLVTLGEDTVEMAHEAIIREWPRLAGWIDEDREGLRLHRHLSHAARDWEALDRDASELYRGPRLAAATDWLAREPNVPLNGLEQQFVQASRDAADAEIARDLERASARDRANRRLPRCWLQPPSRWWSHWSPARWPSASATRANRAASVLHAEAVRAEVGRLIALSETLQSENRYLGVLLALQANRLEDDAQTRGAILAAVLADPRHVETLPVAGSTSARLLDDGTSALVLTGGRVERWDVRRGTRTSAMGFRGVSSLAMRPDGQAVAVATADRIQIVDLQGRPVAPTIVTNKSTSAQSLAFSPDGSLLAAAFGYFADPHPYDGSKWAQIYRVATGRPTGPALSGRIASISTVAFSPDGRELATGGNDSRVVVHDLATGAIVGDPMVMSTPVWSVAFDPVHPRVLVGDLAPEMGVFDAASGRQIRRLASVVQATPTFAPDGHVVAVGGNGPVQLYDSTRLEAAGAPIDAQTGTEIPVFRSDGRLVISGSSGPVTVWDLAGRSVLDRPVPDAATYVFPLPGGQLVAAPDFGDAVTLYDAQSLRRLGELSPGRGADFVNTLVPTAFAASYYDGSRIAVAQPFGPAPAVRHQVAPEGRCALPTALRGCLRRLLPGHGHDRRRRPSGQVAVVDLHAHTVTDLASPIHNYVSGWSSTPMAICTPPTRDMSSASRIWRVASRAHRC